MQPLFQSVIDRLKNGLYSLFYSLYWATCIVMHNQGCMVQKLEERRRSQCCVLSKGHCVIKTTLHMSEWPFVGAPQRTARRGFFSEETWLWSKKCLWALSLKSGCFILLASSAGLTINNPKLFKTFPDTCSTLSCFISISFCEDDLYFKSLEITGWSTVHYLTACLCFQFLWKLC